MKIAMIQADHRLRQLELPAALILQVHDELVFDVEKSELERLKPLVSDHMRHALPNLKVPTIKPRKKRSPR